MALYSEFNSFQKSLGHCGEGTLKTTARAHEWKLLGNFKISQDCTIGKAKQKTSIKRSPIAPGGERLYIEVSSIKGESFGDSRFRALIVDDFTD